MFFFKRCNIMWLVIFYMKCEVEIYSIAMNWFDFIYKDFSSRQALNLNMIF